jgi:hypothetical protein
LEALRIDAVRESVNMSASQKRARSRIDLVAAILEGYARRGVFRGFSQKPVRRGKAAFTMVWHRDRVFELVFDYERNTMRFPLVLPNVPADSEMYAAFKAFVKSRHSDELPEHRRIDHRKAEVRSYNRAGNVSLTLTVKNGDCEYGARRLIHLVHEVFLTFLLDGWYEYMVENLDLDPDRV